MYASSSYIIRGYHCDSYGHLNNARYLELFEDARWNWLDEAGIVQPIRDKGLLFFVVSITVNYRLPVDDGLRIEIRTSLKEFGRKKLVLQQLILQEGTERVLTDALVSFVLFNVHDNKAQLLGDDLKELFIQWSDGSN